MKITQFKNGNFNVKRPKWSEGLIYDLVNSHELDFIIAGYEGCTSNYDMYYPLYNLNTCLIYLPTGQDCMNYNSHKTVKLVGRVPDEHDLELLREEGIID